MSKKVKSYCLYCGNSLDPKIHILESGRGRKDVARFQRGILRECIRSLYFHPHNPSFNEMAKECTSIVQYILEHDGLMK